MGLAVKEQSTLVEGRHKEDCSSNNVPSRIESEISQSELSAKYSKEKIQLTRTSKGRIDWITKHTSKKRTAYVIWTAACVTIRAS